MTLTPTAKAEIRNKFGRTAQGEDHGGEGGEKATVVHGDGSVSHPGHRMVGAERGEMDCPTEAAMEHVENGKSVHVDAEVPKQALRVLRQVALHLGDDHVGFLRSLQGSQDLTADDLVDSKKLFDQATWKILDYIDRQLRL